MNIKLNKETLAAIQFLIDTDTKSIFDLDGMARKDAQSLVLANVKTAVFMAQLDEKYAPITNQGCGSDSQTTH